MATTRIQCPGCQAKFTLKASSLDSIANKSFRCPKCSYVISFDKIMPRKKAVEPLHTHIAGGVGDAPGGHTKLANTGGTQLELFMEGSGKSLKLGNGIYTLGRDSSDSRASLKISPDKYMSRLHAQLEVMMNPTGVSFPICRISSLSATNPIFVNNDKLEVGKSVELKSGDKILLGMTKLIVKM